MMQMMQLGRVGLGVLVGAACGTVDGPPPPPIPPGTVVQEQFSARGVSFPYLLFEPHGWRADRPMPVLLLIHGSGGQGSFMLDLWKAFADTEGVILVAPTFQLGPDLESEVPWLFPALMDSVRARVHFDTTQVYVFGYSAGGYAAYDAATLASTTFTRAGVFAGIITPDYDWILGKAVRKTPIAIYIGDHDEFFTLDQTRRTRDVLQAAGFPVHYVELKDRDHNYAAVSTFVNRDAWAFWTRGPAADQAGGTGR